MSDPYESPTSIDQLEARLAARMATLLSEPTLSLAPDIVERLRFAREQALSRARTARAVAPMGVSGGAAVLGRLGHWWPRMVAVLPAVALAIGLLAVSEWNTRERARAAADIDSVLLADQLPPAAYADPGFVAFLKLAQP